MQFLMALIFVGSFLTWCVGINLAFQAGIVMGILTLLVEPMPLLVAVVYMLTPEHINLASTIGKALGLH